MREFAVLGVLGVLVKKTRSYLCLVRLVNRNPVDLALVVRLADALASDAERFSFNEARINFAQRVGAGYVFSEEEVFSLAHRSFGVLPTSVDYHPRLGVDGQQPDWSLHGVGGSSIVGSFDGCVPYMEAMASSLARRGVNFNLQVRLLSIDTIIYVSRASGSLFYVEGVRRSGPVKFRFKIAWFG